jgi:hypothetical protein
LNKHTLDVDYYKELVGGNKDSSIETMVNDAPEWVRVRRGDKRLWVGLPQGTEILMVSECALRVKSFA